jgi:hypothetical protein
MTKDQILTTLESGHDTIAEYVSSLTHAVFYKSSPAYWGPAHHLGHLSLIYEAVSRGFRAKERLPEYTDASKSYEAFRDSYLEKLKTAPAGFLTNNPFTASLEGTTRESIISTFRQKAQSLCQVIQSYSEQELDAKGMKHPLVGLISAREMAMFMAFHDQHHLEGIKHCVNQKV